MNVVTDPDLEERIHDAELAANDGKSPNGKGLLHGLRTGDWLDGQTFPPLRYAVPGLVPEGLVLNVGPPKIGKSWELLDFALAIAWGGRALGHLDVGEPRPVLMLALEDGDRRLQDRCRKLLDGGTIPPGFHYMTRTEPGRILDTLHAWASMYPDELPVMFVDTLGKCMPPAFMGESAYQRDYRIGSQLKAIADAHAGCSLVVNHHDRKAGSEDFVDNVSGTNGLAGAADTILVLSRRRHETAGIIQVTGRDVAEGEYAVEFVDGCHWVLAGGSLDAAASRADRVKNAGSLGDRSLDVLDLVNQHPEGITAAQIDEKLDITGARTYLSRLKETDRIVSLRRGVYGPRPPVATVAVLHPAGDDDPTLQQRNTCNTRYGDHERARLRSLEGLEQ